MSAAEVQQATAEARDRRACAATDRLAAEALECCTGRRRALVRSCRLGAKSAPAKRLHHTRGEKGGKGKIYKRTSTQPAAAHDDESAREMQAAAQQAAQHTAAAAERDQGMARHTN